MLLRTAPARPPPARPAQIRVDGLQSAQEAEVARDLLALWGWQSDRARRRRAWQQRQAAAGGGASGEAPPEPDLPPLNHPMRRAGWLAGWLVAPQVEGVEGCAVACVCIPLPHLLPWLPLVCPRSFYKDCLPHMAQLGADQVAPYVRVVLSALDPDTLPPPLPEPGPGPQAQPAGQQRREAAGEPQLKRRKGEAPAGGGGGGGGLASLADQLDVLANAAAAADGVASPAQRQQQQQQGGAGGSGAAGADGAALLRQVSAGSGPLGESGLVPGQAAAAAAAAAQRNLEAAARAFEQADTSDPATMLAPFKCLLRAQPGSRTLRVGGCCRLVALASKELATGHMVDCCSTPPAPPPSNLRPPPPHPTLQAGRSARLGRLRARPAPGAV